MATKNNVVYMAVTADEFELPLAVTDTIPQMAQIFEKTTSNIYSSISRGHTGRYNKVKFIRVELD